MRLERRYEAEAAHQLTAGVPVGHPCRRLHGHRYVITVTIIGPANPETAMLMEYADIDRRVAEVLGLVDHRFVNFLGQEAIVGQDPTSSFPVVIVGDIADARILEPELAEMVRENSTVENLAAWFLAELKHRFPRKDFKVGPLALAEPQVYAVRIEEDSRSAVEAS